MSDRIETYRNRPTRALISVAALENNFRIVQKCVGPERTIMAMVKADAYGHGILEISRIMLKLGAGYLGVAYLEEAVYLRKNGIEAPILVLGAINTDQIDDFLENGIEITASSIDKSRAISEAAVRKGVTAKVHLKIDTGMERIGVHWYNAKRFIAETLDMPGIDIRGIFSHLAKAESDTSFTAAQLDRFEETLEIYGKLSPLPPYVHIANSAAVLNYPRSYYTMVRPGILLYGYDPAGLHHGRSCEGMEIEPAMSLISKVSYFKVCPPETGISYGHTYKTPSQTRVVTLPVGYGDGYSRLLSNQGETIIRGKTCPVAGTICMDQMMVDIGPDGTAYNGDDALLFGKYGESYIPLESLCSKIGTIPYEFLCGISGRVPRIYTNCRQESL